MKETACVTVQVVSVGQTVNVSALYTKSICMYTKVVPHHLN